MKAAMWGVGIVVFGLFGLVLINLFGNITVTNQFNYTTMKNAVQAAMLDSLDVAYYRTGFCICTTDGSKIGTDKKTFSNKNQYVLSDIINGECESVNSCVALYGEYRIDSEKFRTILEERFSSVITNNKEYDYVIKEIIEYPPKISVRIISHDDEFSPTEKDSDGYNIVNQIDAVIETNGGDPYISVLEEKSELDQKKKLVCLNNGSTSDDTSSFDDESSDDGSTSVIVNNCKWHYEGDVTCKLKNYKKWLSSSYGSYNTKVSAKNDCDREAINYCLAYNGVSINNCQGVRRWKITCKVKKGITSASASVKYVNSDITPSCPCADGCKRIECLG